MQSCLQETKSVALFLYTNHQVKPKRNTKHFLTFRNISVRFKSKIQYLNLRCSNWWKSDIENTLDGKNCLTVSYDLSQIINKPTHILSNSLFSIDLIFTSDSNMVRKSGVHSSLYPNCDHQIVFSKFNLKIYYHAPYESWYSNTKKQTLI